MGVDSPRGRPDARPDDPNKPWYHEHAEAEHARELKRHRYAPAAEPEYFRRRELERAGYPRDQIPAPFNERAAEQVPGGRALRIDSGARRGPDGTERLGFADQWESKIREQLPGTTPYNHRHVERHAGGFLRLYGLREATLYVNNQPCPGRYGCDRQLPRLLPETAKLTVYGPGGFRKEFLSKLCRGVSVRMSVQNCVPSVGVPPAQFT